MLSNYILKHGLIAAGLSIVIILLLYLIDPNLVVSGFTAVIFIIWITSMILAVREHKQQQGGFISWKEAVKTAWFTSMVTILPYFFFNLLLFKVIDPDLMETVKEKQLEMMEKFAGFGGDEGRAEMEKQMEAIQNEDIYSVKNSLTNISMQAIIGFIVAAIIALAMKEQKPDDPFANYSE